MAQPAKGAGGPSFDDLFGSSVADGGSDAQDQALFGAPARPAGAMGGARPLTNRVSLFDLNEAPFRTSDPVHEPFPDPPPSRALEPAARPGAAAAAAGHGADPAPAPAAAHAPSGDPSPAPAAAANPGPGPAAARAPSGDPSPPPAAAAAAPGLGAGPAPSPNPRPSRSSHRAASPGAGPAPSSNPRPSRSSRRAASPGAGSDPSPDPRPSRSSRREKGRSSRAADVDPGEQLPRELRFNPRRRPDPSLSRTRALEALRTGARIPLDPDEGDAAPIVRGSPAAKSDRAPPSSRPARRVRPKADDALAAGSRIPLDPDVDTRPSGVYDPDEEDAAPSPRGSHAAKSDRAPASSRPARRVRPKSDDDDEADKLSPSPSLSTDPSALTGKKVGPWKRSSYGPKKVAEAAEKADDESKGIFEKWKDKFMNDPLWQFIGALTFLVTLAVNLTVHDATAYFMIPVGLMAVFVVGVQIYNTVQDWRKKEQAKGNALKIRDLMIPVLAGAGVAMLLTKMITGMGLSTPLAIAPCGAALVAATYIVFSQLNKLLRDRLKQKPGDSRRMTSVKRTLLKCLNKTCQIFFKIQPWLCVALYIGAAYLMFHGLIALDQSVGAKFLVIILNPWLLFAVIALIAAPFLFLERFGRQTFFKVDLPEPARPVKRATRRIPRAPSSGPAPGMGAGLGAPSSGPAPGTGPGLGLSPGPSSGA